MAEKPEENDREAIKRVKDGANINFIQHKQSDRWTTVLLNLISFSSGHKCVDV